MNLEQRKVNSKNLRMLCWKCGYHGVAGLAKKIGRARVTVHRAAKRPHLFKPTYKLIMEALIEK